MHAHTLPLDGVSLQSIPPGSRDSYFLLASSSSPPQSVRTDAPTWWHPDATENKAIDDWDHRHASYLTRARLATLALHTDSTNLRKEAATEVAIWELGHNRFFMREHVDVTVPPFQRYKKVKKKKEKPRPWKLVNSIWRHRRKTCDSKDFYDPPDVKKRAFDIDWERAREEHNLDKKLARAAKHIHDAEAQRHITPEAFKDAMFAHCDLIYQVFHYYCVLSAGDDIFCMTNNAFVQIAREANLVNNSVPGQRDADVQLMFESACAHHHKLEEGDSKDFDSKHALDRIQWVATIAQLVLKRHMEGAGLGLVEAVRCFFIDDIAHNVPSVCLQDSNVFRAECCYIEQTDLVLRKYEASLQNIYVAFAYGSGAIGDAILSTKLLDFKEYLVLINRLELVDNFITMREVRLIFIWSRMVVVDEKTIKGRASTLQLHFEDFLELIVRFAHMMALPTQQELTCAGMRHAGEYLKALKSTPELEAQFKRQRTREAGEHADQSIAWKVRQFALWLIFNVRGGRGDPEKELSKEEADKFMRGRVGVSRVSVDHPQTISVQLDEVVNGAEDQPGCDEDGAGVQLVRNQKTAPSATPPEPVAVPLNDSELLAAVGHG